MAVGDWILYGANGYTGELAAREAARRGLEPLLAGRDGAAVGRLADELGLDHRVFALDDPEALARGVDGAAAVLHCAGPFVHTARPMVAACLAAGAGYLDITGEIAVFERLQRLAGQARRAGVALVPGVGFDVVPTDCLAARLAEALPDARSLELAFYSPAGGVSRGTLKTMVEALPAAGAIRRERRIERVPIAWRSRKIPFSCGERWVVTLAWGDVSTAFHTTGIPDIRVYTGAPPGAIRRMRLARPLLPLAGLGPVKRLLQRRIERKVTGPDAATRASARTYLWGRVESAGGEAVTGTFDTPEAYALTAVSAVEAARRVAAGEVEPGTWTPARAFGPGFAESLPGVTKIELTRQAC